MATRARSRGAARCTACERVLAVWSSPDDIVPIGSVTGCPCGNSSFELLESATDARSRDVAAESRDL